MKKYARDHRALRMMNRSCCNAEGSRTVTSEINTIEIFSHIQGLMLKAVRNLEVYASPEAALYVSMLHIQILLV